MSRYLRMGALAGAGAILATALGGAAIAQDQVDIEWWHIDTNDPGLSLRQEVADEYMAEHPDVNINITVLENEAFKQKLALDMQAGSAPDIFNSWGGGVLAEQAEAGMARPIEDEIADWVDTMNPAAMSIYQVDGVQYGVPYNFGLVGFWYNQDLFAEAGIDEPPATWDEFLEDVAGAQGRGHHAHRPGCRGQVAGDVLLGLPGAACRRAGGHGRGHLDRRLDRSGLHRGR